MAKRFLMEMPRPVLFGQAQGMEVYLKAKGLQRPTLLDVVEARVARKNESRNSVRSKSRRKR